MDNLKKLLDMLYENQAAFEGEYYIPDIWNSFGFGNFKTNNERHGEISVNPYEFARVCINDFIMPHAVNQKPLTKKKRTLTNADISKKTVYSIFPRMYTAWNHYDDGRICSGTFLKTLLLLPYLKELNVDVIYLLPLFQYSDRYKKGEVGSPYAIKNIYKFDPNLHDDLLGDYTEDKIAIEFKAFVEACHILEIKVMVDFVFRSCSRDNDLLLEHPDWFYWIKKEHLEGFQVSDVTELPPQTTVNTEAIKCLYAKEETKEYIKWFIYDPKTLDSKKWEELVKRQSETGENILSLIEEYYNITTVPGFSDVLNDAQPPWTDVTFYRFYFDVNPQVKSYLDGEYPPFILQDAVKSSLFPGNVQNSGIMDYILGVIPYYQNNYGIDGARIDMGHALPSELNKKIISAAKKINPEFLLWSEEFNPKKSEAAKEEGFHFISGALWSTYQDLHKLEFEWELNRLLMDSVLPVAAAIETPDTPRAAYLYQDRRMLEMLALINSFIPNSLTFINNGFEIMEKQPMNLGLGNTEKGRYVLDENDPMYGKLAFFDIYKMHWANTETKWMMQTIKLALELRKKYISTISDKSKYIKINEYGHNQKLIMLCYKGSKDKLFLIANKDFERDFEIKFNEILPMPLHIKSTKVKIIYNNGDVSDIECSMQDSWIVRAGRVIIGVAY